MHHVTHLIAIVLASWLGLNLAVAVLLWVVSRRAGDVTGRDRELGEPARQGRRY